MCNTCGCETSHSHEGLDHLTEKVIDASVNLMAHNDHIAAHNRKKFEQRNVLVINLMSSPGSGKTLLLESTIRHFRSKYKIAVIEGDLETENDALRIRNVGAQAEQISTGSACHLDATMVEKVLPRFSLNELDVLFIENVGNLICPACFDLGQKFDVVLLSVPEGDDKPAKYPVMFRSADLMLLTKIDFLPVCQQFSTQRAISSFRNIGNGAPVIQTSCSTSEGLGEWFEWLEGHIIGVRHSLISGSKSSTTGHADVSR
tara:strand:- start:607 stop:1383 length:777 start_codon:yes stop_codon:yes gene_type:complete